MKKTILITESTNGIRKGSAIKMVKKAFGNSWSPADKGANILYDLAVSEEYEGISGKYFDNDKGIFGKAHQDAYDRNKIDRLVEATDEILSGKEQH